MIDFQLMDYEAWKNANEGKTKKRKTSPIEPKRATPEGASGLTRLIWGGGLLAVMKSLFILVADRDLLVEFHADAPHDARKQEGHCHHIQG